MEKNSDQPPGFVLHQGQSPLMISIPHVGTYLPPDIKNRLQSHAHQVTDTDWHLDLLYQFAKAMDITVLQATYSRYVIDLNRPPDNANLYPGQNTTGLCPTDDFTGQAIYLPGQEPTPEEIAHRIENYWQPYHSQISLELARLSQLHKRVVLWDAHSIASRVPRFFEGQLPDFNFGTADHHSCPAEISLALLNTMKQNPEWTYVLNGRFKGGHITRHYGNADSNIWAIQLEMSQRLYMSEQAPFEYLAISASRVQLVLKQLLAQLQSTLSLSTGS